MDEELLKKAKKRTLYLLERMDRTEMQLRQKLQQNGYPEDVIDEAVSYAASFRYINDEGYARRYVEGRRNRKSRMEIRMELLQKGVDREIVQQVLEEAYAMQDETEAILQLLSKRHFDAETATPEDKRKVQEYLVRKGFRYEDVCRAIQVFSSNA